MKAKKSKRANLENLRTIFIQIGLVITLSLILVAFEWKSAAENTKELIINTDYKDLTVLPPVTMPKQEVKAVKPPSFEIEIIEDIIDIDIDEDLQGLLIGLEDYEPLDLGDIVRDDEVVDDDPFISAEFMPTFLGKDRSYFRNYVAENVKFPKNAIENGISGTVYVTFVIDRDGSVIDIALLRGVHPIIDKAVLNAIRNSPKWEPGMHNGTFVKVKYSISVAFELL